MKTVSTGTGTNKKYPDVPDYYGDKAEWDSWRFHLDTKFRQSAVLYPLEQDKMDYIRDHCKAIAFDVIKTRADPMNTTDPYITSTEMIQELHSHFGDFDKYTLCDAELHDPAFAMKNNETFDRFYARFSATVAPLGYTESTKIRTLERLLTNKLRYRMIDGSKPTSFRHYVERARMIDQNMRLWAKQAGVEEIEEEEFYGPSSSTKDSVIDYPSNFKAQLKNNGRCFKCLGYGHRPGPEAPCANAKHLSYEKAKALLANEAKENAIEKN